LFAGKNPVSGMLNRKGVLAAFLYIFANYRKRLTYAIFWLRFRWINEKTSSVVA